MKTYICSLCGNVVEVIRDSAIVPVCCGKQMETIKVNKNDETAHEKHVPVLSKIGNDVRVVVGSQLHPSLKEHYIEWIALETNKGIYRKNLKCDDIPSVSFHVDDDEEIINVYSYCNIHGLWALN